MNLAKLLKYKKRVAQRIAKVSSDISGENCVMEQNEREVNIRELIAERGRLVTHMVDLKTKLAVANVTSGVQKRIFVLDELKSEISFLNGLNTNHGEDSPGWRESEPVKWKSEIRKAERDESVIALEKLIDETQDEIDTLNHSVTVDLEPIL